MMTAIEALWKERGELSAWVNGPESQSVPEMVREAVYSQLYRMEDEISEKPAAGLGDVKVKLLLLLSYREDGREADKGVPELLRTAIDGLSLTR
jgi:hypothetical protein